MSYSKTILLSIGLLSFVTDMIEFIQIISLYIFLDVKLPVNLAAVLSTFYEQINANVVPIEPPDIISNSGATFYLASTTSTDLISTCSLRIFSRWLSCF